jgi:hypothetical protein
MWVLLLVITGVVELNGPKIVAVTALGDPHSSEAACELERTRITEAMVQSYPGDTDYYLECKLVNPVVRKEVNL